MKTVENIKDLEGTYLSDVCFVMDYLQLGFSGAKITVYSKPIVELSGQRWRLPEAGARDALCSLIGRTLVKVIVVDQQSIALKFDIGKIEILLDAINRVNGDAAEFIAASGKPIWDY